MDLFQKYKLDDVGPTRSRLAELISIFEERRKTMSIEELGSLREEIELLTARLSAEQAGDSSPR